MTPTAALGDSIGCMIHFGSDGCCSPRPQKPGKILFMRGKMVDDPVPCKVLSFHNGGSYAAVDKAVDTMGRLTSGG